MKPCSSSFVAVATCLSALALHVRPIASTCQSCEVELDCILDDNNTTHQIGFAFCDPEIRRCVNLDGLRDIDCFCSMGEDCQSGLCKGNPSGATCQHKLEDGDSPCSNGVECQSGRCEGSPSDGASTCQAKLEDGTFCSEDSDCVNGNCNIDFICLSISTEEESTRSAHAPTPPPTRGEKQDRNFASYAGFYFLIAVGVISLGLLAQRCYRRSYPVCAAMAVQYRYLYVDGFSDIRIPGGRK